MTTPFAWMSFYDTQAREWLERLAEEPFDLTAPDALSPERIRSMRSTAVGFDLLYATQRVTGEVLAALQQVANETGVVEEFEAMMAGAVMNQIVGHPSEQRQVLHTASRDVSRDPAEADAPDAAAKAREQLDKLETFLNEIGGEFTDLVQVGIGGSDLGPRAIYLALCNDCGEVRRVHFISNVDPDDATKVLRDLEARGVLDTTLVAIITKSGTTLETLTNQDFVARYLADARTRAGKPKPSIEEIKRNQFVLVSAHPEKVGKGPSDYLAVFGMEDHIGGRFSATSMVGGVALGFGLGYERFEEILEGAREMDLNALEPDVRNNLPLLSALLGVWNRNFLGCDTVAILPYSQMLSRFVAHLQQLDMESNGKRVNRCGCTMPYRTGPIVWGEPGTNGQHAFYQLIHQSERVIPCELIGFRECQLGRDLEVQETTSQQKLLANLLAQAEALATGKADANPNKVFPGNRPSSVLIGERLTPKAIGALLAYYEAKVAFQGFLWNINSFDQEGVQLGKKLAEKYLGHFKAGTRPDGDDDDTGWAMMEAARLC